MVGGRDVVIPSFLRDIHDSISMNHLRRGPRFSLLVESSRAWKPPSSAGLFQ